MIHAPITPSYTMTKIKNVLPSQKAKVENALKSNIIYKITCARCASCYIGMTCRHFQTRLKEHFQSNGTMVKHMQECNTSLDPMEVSETIDSSFKGPKHLSILEAIHIRTNNPGINTRDEYRCRELRIRI